MHKFIKIILIVAGCFLGLILILTVALRLLFPPAKLRQWVLDQIHTQLHREAQLGDVHIGIGGLTLERFRLSEVSSFSAGTFLAVDRIQVRWALKPFLSKEAVIEEVLLENPQVNLIRMADGKTFNISDLAGASATSGKTPPSEVTKSNPSTASGAGGWTWRVDQIHLSHGMIRFDDRSPAHQTSALSDIDLVIHDFDPTQMTGHLAIAQLQNPVYIARDFSVEWDLHGIDPNLGHLNGAMHLKQGAGTIQNLTQLANSSKGAKLALMPLVMLQNVSQLGFIHLGLPDLSHLTIDHITGDYQFKQGTMQIQDFNIASPQLSISASGTVELVSGQLAVDVSMHAPKSTLAGQTDLKLQISGTLSNPKTNLNSLKQQAFKATVSGLLNNPDNAKNLGNTLKQLFH